MLGARGTATSLTQNDAFHCQWWKKEHRGCQNQQSATGPVDQPDEVFRTSMDGELNRYEIVAAIEAGKE